MSEYSKVTLEPLESMEMIFKKMVDLYVDEYGYGDLFDAWSVVKPSDMTFEMIGMVISGKIEQRNYEEMTLHGRCPDCGCELTRKVEPRTRDYPGAEWIECPECQQEFKEVG
jgi:uncharacterized C2H2 Zn-finger protein